MANLYTKGGDKGQTSLVGGGRVSKSDPKVECYGTIDEANSMLGMAYTQTDNEFIRTTVRKIQGRLFSVGAELASDSPETAAALKGNISEEDVAFLEGVVDTCTLTTGKQTHFVIPGVDPASAALHVARTIVRRAERRIVELPVREVLVRYINRLSDAIYAMARLQEDLTQMREKVTGLVKEAMEQQGMGGFPPMNLDILHRMAGRGEIQGAGRAGGVLRRGRRRQPDVPPADGGGFCGQRGGVGRQGLYRVCLPDAHPRAGRGFPAGRPPVWD